MISNMHTHTCFCDGKDAPEEIVLAAINLGFDTIGFSGHSKLSDCDWCISDEKKYFDEIQRLKSEYAGKINILCGIEQDFYSDEPGFETDFRIGSVHFVNAGGKLCAVDESRKVTLGAINEAFGGDPLKFAANYYEAAALCPKRTKADIIGHFDLLTKFEGIFDEEDKKYRSLCLESLEEAAKYGKPFEINTGAIARGYDKIYPAPFILKRLKELGGSITVSTDCHDKAKLDFGFADACSLAKSCGFDSYICYVGGKPKAVLL